MTNSIAKVEVDTAKDIERLIDRFGISRFLSLTGYVCGEKAEHVAEHWQDARTAKIWMELSAALDKLTARAEEWEL